MASFIDMLGVRIATRRAPTLARETALADHRQGLQDDPGADRAIREAAAWLCRAQDNTASHDDGVARDYSLINGWATSYPETTGYIVPTMMALADYLKDETYDARARRMLDWFVAIQLEGGGFQAGKIDADPIVPTTFNTGQILLGLAAGVTRYNAYQDATIRAAQWLVDTQDPDGAWRKWPSPFTEAGEKAYETHVSWSLLEADRVCPGQGFAAAGLKQVDWALQKQQPNGWIADCCLDEPDAPLTHTLGYYLKGVVEAHRFSGDSKYLETARKLADGLMGTQRPDGALPGQLRADWSPSVKWSCLTGDVQVADSWIYLFKVTGETRYRDAALAANRFVRRTLYVSGPEEMRGGVKGAFPVDGDYGRFQFLNWAAKFMIDANLAELSLG